MKKATLIVSLHDVSPQTQEVVTKQLEELRALGVSRCSLLVIPNYHHHGSINKFPHFVTWLHEQAEQGHEIVLHGYYHLRSGRSDDSGWKRWITQHYTAGEGEFYDLGYDEARTLLQKGKQELSQAGCDMTKVTGFIAPAWLLGKEAERAVVDEGFSYTTRLHGVAFFRNFTSDANCGVAPVRHSREGRNRSSSMRIYIDSFAPAQLALRAAFSAVYPAASRPPVFSRCAPEAPGTSLPEASLERSLVIDFQKKSSRFFLSQSMVYSVRSAWRRQVSLVWNELLFQYAAWKKWPLLRIGFHPIDWDHPAIKAHLLSSVKRAVTTRTPMTYGAWMHEAEG